MNNRKKSYLIIGQGLAGTLMTHFLLEKGQKVQVIDTHHENSSSVVAAGIINPITGRRYVKSWKIETLLPVAQATYAQLEKQLGIQIYYPHNILRAIFNHREEQDWYARTIEPSYQSYIVPVPNPAEIAGHTDEVYRYGELTQTARVDMLALVQNYRKFLISSNRLITTTFDYEQLIVEEEGVQYGDTQADSIIFCEGQRGQLNPFFNYLPFNVAKGETLIIRIPGADFSKIVKHRVFIVPIGEDLYWTGSTYDWEYEDDKPTRTGYEYLKGRLEDMLKVPFEIVEHQAAIRPAIKDRRPLLGAHPNFPQLNIFNGLGAKGASLAPYFAQQMSEFLVNGMSIEAEVDIKRFV